MSAVKYFLLKLKGSIRVLPFILLISVVLCFLMRTVLDTAIKRSAESDGKTKLRVGIVGETDTSYLGIGIAAVQNLDSTRFSVDFIKLSEEKAKHDIERGNIAAYFVIPDGFVDAIVRGDLLPITYVSSAGSVGTNSIFKSELLEMITTLLVESQKGVYGVEGIAEMTGAGSDSDVSNEISVRFFDFVLNRNKIYRLDLLGFSDGVSLEGYFLSGISTLFLLLWGMTCCQLFVRNDATLHRILSSRGIGPFSQILSELAVYYILMALNFAVVTVALYCFVGSKADVIPEIANMGTSSFYPLFLSRILPAAVTIGALQFFLYEAVTGIVPGMLLQFVCGMGLGYITGCLYPITFFPDSVQKLSRYLPSGIARSYIADGLTGSGNGRLPFLLLWAVLFIAAAVLIRKYRIKGRVTA